MIDLKSFRQNENISQAELCTVLGIAQSYLSSIENGKRPLNGNKFILLYKHYGDKLLKYSQTYEPLAIIEEAELSIHPEMQKYLLEKLGHPIKDQDKHESVGYDFIKSIMEERKRHDEMIAELISQNKKLIENLSETIKILSTK